MFPSECVLQNRVRSDGDKDLADNSFPLFILECKDRKADGYAENELDIYNQRLKDMVIGVRLADAPPAVSYLAILGARLYGSIVAVDKTVIVISLVFTGVGGRKSYLVYDAVALSLRLIAPPANPSWLYTPTSDVSLARAACQADVYALVHTAMLAGVDEDFSLYLWRPSSSSPPPWSEKKKPSFRDLIVNEVDTIFSFNGRAYWVDLLCGVSYYSCNALLDDKSTSVVKFRCLHLPVEPCPGEHHRNCQRVAEPATYRTMGVVRDSFIRFVSIDGFQDYVELKKRTVTVWKLRRHEGWEQEHKFSLNTLWGFEGFGDDVSRDLSPMFPFLSTKDADVVYLLLGEYREDRFRFKFMPSKARYLLAVDMRKNIVKSVPLADWFRGPFHSWVSAGIFVKL